MREHGGGELWEEGGDEIREATCCGLCYIQQNLTDERS